MACHTVFNTTELLEGILFYVPLFNLLHVQGVCKQWQQVITSSSALQEQLFFRPAKSDFVWLVDILNLPSGLGPLPRQYETRVRVRRSVPVKSAELDAHHGLLAYPVQINPLCLQRLEHASDLDKDANHGTPVVLHSEFDAFESHEAKSWQNMLLCNPPVQYVTLEYGSTHVPDSFARLMHMISISQNNIRPQTATSKIFVEDGVRVRHIIAELDKLGRSHSGFRDEYAIYMHGCIAVTGTDEETVRYRTKQWREGNADFNGWDLV